MVVSTRYPTFEWQQTALADHRRNDIHCTELLRNVTKFDVTARRVKQRLSVERVHNATMNLRSCVHL
ncbi:hypothetical protein C8Q74DRAFT_1299736 [Fomes fomentarius]|nr:hypothetical protein C8Q74DRAFT_1299736 [Fomes fomentarius]